MLKWRPANPWVFQISKIYIHRSTAVVLLLCFVRQNLSFLRQNCSFWRQNFSCHIWIVHLCTIINNKLASKVLGVLVGLYFINSSYWDLPGKGSSEFQNSIDITYVRLPFMILCTKCAPYPRVAPPVSLSEPFIRYYTVYRLLFIK